MKPTRINQLYQAAFTELPIANHRRHVAMAVLDCFSRYLLTLRVSPTAAASDLVQGLDQALEEARRVSELPGDQMIALVTDRDPTTTAQVFSDYIAASPFQCVTSEDRTFRSLGIVRRFMWALKDEETSLNVYRSPAEAQRSMDRFRRIYNHERPHQALGYKVPADIFCKERT